MLLLLILILQEVHTLAAFSTDTSSRFQGSDDSTWVVGRPQPYFAETPLNFSLISGHTAYLPCRVHLLGDRQVTWMRDRDLHILTIGRITYTADERFQVLHSDATDDWTLQIMYSQPRDSGRYTCQVNSQDKIVRQVYLTVTDIRYLDNQLYKPPPELRADGGFGTQILGASERFLQAGSSLPLVCVVTHTKGTPTAILWYHNTNVVDYDAPRGGISLQVEKTAQQTTSRLILSSVTDEDSGNYSCVPVNAPKYTVQVHVNSDELRAAVQQGGISSGSDGTTLQGVVVYSRTLAFTSLALTNLALTSLATGQIRLIFGALYFL